MQGCIIPIFLIRPIDVRDGCAFKLTIGTFILDFQSVRFEPDATIVTDMLNDYQELCGITNETFALDQPVESAGWSFAKLFISGEFAEKLYSIFSVDIDKCKGKKFECKFVSWLNLQLKARGCAAQVKAAKEML